MEFHLHRHRKLSEVVPVPEGLRDLMADITREVLRFQPENMENFIADYLEAMLLTRELYQIADRTVEDILDSSCQIAEILGKEGMSKKQAESAVNVIREEFQKHFADMEVDDPLKEMKIMNRLINECGFTTEQAEKASGIIESAWCHYYQRNKVQAFKISPDLAHHDAVKNTLSLYQNSKSKRSNLNVNKSAQALEPGFKSYLARKALTSAQKNQESKDNWQTPNFQQREEAALKIQSWFRGLKIRNNYKEMVKAAKKIQAGFKGYKVRKNLKQENATEKRVKISIDKPKSEVYNHPTDEIREQAATKIQSWWRENKRKKEFEIQTKAATTIQAHFRGFMTRKKLPEKN
jgi:hypothetical protein